MRSRPWKARLSCHISFVGKVAIPCHWSNGQRRTASLDIPMVSLPSLQQLRFLCALAEQCHFGRAAETCAVTQSTLSGGIKELEARLGVTLFERSHRHVMPTPLGKEIAARAQRLLVDPEALGGVAG